MNINWIRYSNMRMDDLIGIEGFGRLFIIKIFPDTFNYFFNGAFSSSHDTLEEAKAAAEAGLLGRINAIRGG